MIYYRMKLEIMTFFSWVKHYKDNLDNLHLPLGYFHDFVYRKNFKTKGFPPGRICYRCELQGKGLVYDKSSENITCIKIDKSVNDYEHGIFVAYVYNSPKKLEIH